MVKYLVSALNINLFLRIGTAKSSEKIFSKQESQGKIFFKKKIMIHTWKGIESSILVEEEISCSRQGITESLRQN